MSLETEIKEAFERHAGDALPAGDTWNGIERRIQRSHRTRAILAGAGAAIAIAAVVLAVPRIGNKPAEPVNPGPVPTAGWKTYENPQRGYRLLYPGDWRQSELSGGLVQFVAPDGLRAPGAAPNTVELFGLSIQVVSRPYDQLPAAKAGEHRSSGTLGGHAFTRLERVENGARFVMVSINWPAPACPFGAPCPRTSSTLRTLIVTITSPDEASWKRYDPTAEQMLRTLGPFGSSSVTPLAVTAKIAVPGFAFATSDDALWTITRAEREGDPGSLVRIDPQRNEKASSIEIGVWPTALAISGNDVWVANGSEAGVATPYPQSNSVMRIDAQTGRVLATIRVDDPQDIAVDGTNVWIIGRSASAQVRAALYRIDTSANRLDSGVDLPGTADEARLAVSDGLVWIAETEAGTDTTQLYRFDPHAPGDFTTYTVPGSGGTIPTVTVGHGSVWVTTSGANSASALARLDPSTGKITARIVLPDAAPVGLLAVTSGPDDVYATSARGYLWRVDPQVNAPRGDPMLIGDAPPVPATDVVYAFGSVWVGAGDGKIWRIHP
jgi:hypothetical protein